MTDRVTINTKLNKFENRNSNMARKTMIERPLQKRKHPVQTIAFDNDKKFSDCMMVANTLNADTYFTRPCVSQDKGTVESRIG